MSRSSAEAATGPTRPYVVEKVLHVVDLRLVIIKVVGHVLFTCLSPWRVQVNLCLVESRMLEIFFFKIT